MKLGGKFFQRKLSPRLSHKVYRFLSSPVLLRKTFYSDARQPKVECFHSWAIILSERFGQIVVMRLKTLSNTNLES